MPGPIFLSQSSPGSAPHWRKITFKKKTRDAVIQAMIEDDERGDFLLA